MRRLYYILFVVISVFLNTSCLRYGLDELDTYSDNDITNVRFEYRWWDEKEERLRIQEMYVEKHIDNESKTIECVLEVPDENKIFTSDIRNKVSLSTLAINVDVSSAARITPTNNSPVMGVFPSDFSSKKCTYSVKAGNGNTVIWTIIIKDFIK